MSEDEPLEGRAVGYRRPPVHSRFQKGRSGNPRGRQKGVRNFLTDLKHSLELPVSLMENGKSKRVSTQLALMLRAREKALKGDIRALENLLKLAQVHNLGGEAEQKQLDLSILTDEELETLSRIWEKLHGIAPSAEGQGAPRGERETNFSATDDVARRDSPECN